MQQYAQVRLDYTLNYFPKASFLKKWLPWKLYKQMLLKFMDNRHAVKKTVETYSWKEAFCPSPTIALFNILTN